MARPNRMSRSGRPNVAAWLTPKAFGVRPLAAVKPAAFLFCVVRLAMPFARLSDHGRQATRPPHESHRATPFGRDVPTTAGGELASYFREFPPYNSSNLALRPTDAAVDSAAVSL